MTQTSRISDALRCILLNAPRGPNLACSRETLSGPPPLQNARLWKDTLAKGKHRIALFRWSGVRLQGMAAARARNGCRVWEIDRFHLASFASSQHSNGYESPELVALELLEQVVEVAGWRDAERVFLRLPTDSPAVPLAQQAGFFPRYTETLLEGEPNIVAPGIDIAMLEESSSEDNYARFQLFCAATPAAVRTVMGLTFDQWRDAQEPDSSGKKEWVIKHNGRVTGWLSLTSRRHKAEVELMCHPHHPELLTGMLDYALAQGGQQSWLVPEFQGAVSQSLHHRGFQETARFTMLIKTVTVSVLQPGLSAVEA